MNEDHKEYRRKLPHIQPEDAVFFITFCSKGALPKHIVEALSKEVQDVKTDVFVGAKEKLAASYAYKEQIEDVLHPISSGEHYMKDPTIAKIIAECLHYLDGKDYKLICYCIMSNHVHFIIYRCSKPLFKIMQVIKSYTAHKCNKQLNRNGGFWQREYYDRIVRNRNDLDKKIKYTINNPVKSGLVANWKDYKFSYCRSEFIEL